MAAVTLPKLMLSRPAEKTTPTQAEAVQLHILESSTFGKAQTRIKRDDEMVQYLDINQGQSLFKGLGQQLVGTARLCDT